MLSDRRIANRHLPSIVSSSSVSVVRRKSRGSLISPATYKEAGVDVDAGNALVDAIRPLADITRRTGVSGSIGGFGGLFDLKKAGYQDPILVAATDGVGTKLKIAVEFGNSKTIGIDLVAMCVNDLVVQAAEPLFFLDYFSTSRLEVGLAREVINGIAEGCQQAGCALIGGETAEMPGLYAPGEYDLAGFAVGAAERDALLPRPVAPGDIILGLASNGAHSNGFSLIRRVVEHREARLMDPAPFAPECLLGDALLRPTRIYVRSCLAAARTGHVRALAHITGGGLVENVARVLPDSCQAIIDASTWERPPVFCWLSEGGAIAHTEMTRAFNCGIGMIAVVAPALAETVTAILTEEGETVRQIGRVESRPPSAPSVQVTATRNLGLRLAVLISGRGSNLQALIDACEEPGFPASIELVISNRPGVAGLARAERSGLNVAVVDHRNFAHRRGFEEELGEHLRELNVQLVCLAGFMRVLTDEFVNNWKNRLINIHPSLLPAFPGMGVHEQALAAGVRISGCTVHFVRAKVDSGPIILQAVVPVDAAEHTRHPRRPRVAS